MKTLLPFFSSLILTFWANQTSQAQYTVIWPTADPTTIRMSQFADSSSIFTIMGNAQPPTGFSGWTTKGIRSVNAAKADSAIWTWTANGQANQGSFYGKVSAGLNSPIVSNTTFGRGAALFNSDFLDSRGTSGRFIGTAPQGASPAPHCGELYSPVIDARGYRNISVVFNQVFRSHPSGAASPCFSPCGISWSEDNGKTWKDTVCILDNEVLGITGQTTAPLATAATSAPVINSQRNAIRLPNSVGTDSFRIKFIFNGEYFFWMIDDIQLAQINNNVMVDPTYVARAPNYLTPHSQSDSLVFAGSVINTGINRATGVKLQAYVLSDSSQKVIYSQTVNVGTLNPGQRSGPIYFPQKAAYPRSFGFKDYFTGYRVTSDSLDQFPSDDSLRYNFSMADSSIGNGYFSLVKPYTNATRPSDASFSAGQPHSWKVGLALYVSSAATAVTFRATMVYTQSLAGHAINAGLYKWVDANNDGQIQRNERELIGSARNIAPDINSMYWVNVAGSGPIILQPNTTYLAMLEFNSTGPTDDLFVYFNDIYWHNATMDAYRKAGSPRYYGVINYNANDESATWSTNVFSGTKYAQTNLAVDASRDGISRNQLAPSITCRFWPIRVDTKEALNDRNQMTLSPNPTADVLKVALDLEKTESVILLRVVDMQGKVLMEKEYDNVKQDVFELQVNHLPAGAYILQLQTLGAYKTKRFVVAK